MQRFTDNFIQGMAKHALTRYRAYSYTVHNLCKCPRRLFTTTVYSRRCPTRPFRTTLYTATVSVQQTIPYYTVHSHCQCPTNYSLIHCTQSLWESNKTISYYTVHSHCQCPTRPFPTTQYKVTVKIQQDHSLLHCTQSPSVSNKPFPATLYTLTVCVQQENLLLHCTNSLSVSNKPIPNYIIIGSL